MLFFGPVSSIFDYATFAVLWYVFGARTVGQASLFQSGWFVEGLLSQTLIVHMIRTRRIPFIQSRASWPLAGDDVSLIKVDWHVGPVHDLRPKHRIDGATVEVFYPMVGGDFALALFAGAVYEDLVY